MVDGEAVADVVGRGPPFPHDENATEITMIPPPPESPLTTENPLDTERTFGVAYE